MKAGLEAAEVVLKEKGKDLPIMLSLTLAGQGGRTLSGQTLMAFLASVQHTNIVSIGLNCSFGAADMKPYLQELAKYAPCYVSAYPNAGLPNSLGEYDETPETMAGHIKPFVDEQLINIIRRMLRYYSGAYRPLSGTGKGYQAPKTSTQTGLPVVIRSGTVGSKTGE